MIVMIAVGCMNTHIDIKRESKAETIFLSSFFFLLLRLLWLHTKKKELRETEREGKNL